MKNITKFLIVITHIYAIMISIIGVVEILDLYKWPQSIDGMILINLIIVLPFIGLLLTIFSQSKNRKLGIYYLCMGMYFIVSAIYESAA
jgi:hypothetical protein